MNPVDNFALAKCLLDNYFGQSLPYCTELYTDSTWFKYSTRPQVFEFASNAEDVQNSDCPCIQYLDVLETSGHIAFTYSEWDDSLWCAIFSKSKEIK